MAKKSGSKSSSRKPATRGASRSARGSARRAPRSAPARSTALAALPTELLARELERRRSEIPALEKRAAGLRAELAEIEARIAALGGSGRSATNRAPAPNPAPRSPAAAGAVPARAKERKGAPTLGARLVEHLAAHPGIHSPGALAGAMASELGRACTQSMIVSTNAALRKLVGQGAVRKVGRGQYSAAGGAAEPQPGGSDDSQA